MVNQRTPHGFKLSTLKEVMPYHKLDKLKRKGVSFYQTPKRTNIINQASQNIYKHKGHLQTMIEMTRTIPNLKVLILVKKTLMIMTQIKL